MRACRPMGRVSLTRSHRFGRSQSSKNDTALARVATQRRIKALWSGAGAARCGLGCRGASARAIAITTVAARKSSFAIRNVHRLLLAVRTNGGLPRALSHSLRSVVRLFFSRKQNRTFSAPPRLRRHAAAPRGAMCSLCRASGSSGGPLSTSVAVRHGRARPASAPRGMAPCGSARRSGWLEPLGRRGRHL